MSKDEELLKDKMKEWDEVTERWLAISKEVKDLKNKIKKESNDDK